MTKTNLRRRVIVALLLSVMLFGGSVTVSAAAEGRVKDVDGVTAM